MVTLLVANKFFFRKSGEGSREVPSRAEIVFYLAA
jgi:hypothetical protein